MLSEEKVREMLAIRRNRRDKVEGIGMPHFHHGLLHDIEILEVILEERKGE